MYQADGIQYYSDDIWLGLILLEMTFPQRLTFKLLVSMVLPSISFVNQIVWNVPL